MVPGFNHNIKYNGRIYHVQTEDSGLKNPYIVSHLFIGGNVLASKKTSYLDISANENAAQIIREMMRDQHKNMVKDLIRGAYDAKLAPGSMPTKTAAPKVETNKITTIDAEAVVKSEKSLDEIILDYLSAKDNKDKRPPS